MWACTHGPAILLRTEACHRRRTVHDDASSANTRRLHCSSPLALIFVYFRNRFFAESSPYPCWLSQYPTEVAPGAVATEIETRHQSAIKTNPRISVSTVFCPARAVPYRKKQQRKTQELSKEKMRKKGPTGYFM